jgi:hypothetical protein
MKVCGEWDVACGMPIDCGDYTPDRRIVKRLDKNPCAVYDTTHETCIASQFEYAASSLPSSGP